MSHNTSLKSRSRRFREALSHYSEALTNNGEDEVISPVALWSLLALILQVSQSNNREVSLDRISRSALNMSLEEANSILEELRTKTALNFSVWGNETYQEWIETAQGYIPAHVRIPTKEELDQWVSENTNKLINEFPIDMNGNIPDIILANALVSDLKWFEPFDVITDKDKIFPVSKILNKEYKSLHIMTVLETDKGENVLKLRFRAEDDKNVYIFIPEDNAEIEQKRFYSHMISSFDKHTPLKDNFKLDEHGWGESTPLKAYSEMLEVTMPAWEVNTKCDLTDSEEIRTIMGQAFPQSDDIKACQVAKASFKKDGLIAAAVTAFMATRSSMPILRDIYKHHVKINGEFGFVVEEAGFPLFVGRISPKSFIEA